MNKVYYLSTCDTCRRIMARIPEIDSFEQIDIKTTNISEADLDRAAMLQGSYEALFSKRARKFRAQNLHEQSLKEEDYKKLILNEYTFLKRPVFFVGEHVYAGNAAKVIDRLIHDLNANN